MDGLGHHLIYLLYMRTMIFHTKICQRKLRTYPACQNVGIHHFIVVKIMFLFGDKLKLLKEKVPLCDFIQVNLFRVFLFVKVGAFPIILMRESTCNFNACY